MQSADDAVAEPAGTPVAIIDLAFLRRQTLGRADLQAEVLALFAAHAQAELARLRLDSDAADRAATVHAIKGSARGIGAWQVAAAAEALERGAAAPDVALARLAAAIEAACGVIAQGVDPSS